MRKRNEELVKIFIARSPDGIIRCHFCGEEVSELKGRESDSLAIHSLDDNHDNWDPNNKVPAHYGHHTAYHLSGKTLTPETKMKISKAQRGEKHWSWQGDEASEKVKYLREWRLRNPNYLREYLREWRLRNPDYQRERRARKRGRDNE